MNVRHRKPRYRATRDEREARVFKQLPEKFGWGHGQVLALTEYQIFWHTYLYPEEREHLEDMDAMSSQYDKDANTTGFGQGTGTGYGMNGYGTNLKNDPNKIYFDNIEEMQAWAARQESKKEAETKRRRFLYTGRRCQAHAAAD